MSDTDRLLRAGEYLAVQRADGEELQDGDEIALGFDGSLTDDAAVLVAVRRTSEDPNPTTKGARMNTYTDEDLDFYTEVFLDLARADKIPASLSDADLVAEAYLKDFGPNRREPLNGPRTYLRRWSVAKGRGNR